MNQSSSSSQSVDESVGTKGYAACLLWCTGSRVLGTADIYSIVKKRIRPIRLARFRLVENGDLAMSAMITPIRSYCCRNSGLLV
ncbi:hypothetical protein CCHR01_18224 [Colletotrichum chrysophilum]|uniref:Uncharacterized protein n=1 Tax=Colletotrichum chrysophilum TaxID=1836956 RepID=A0AAD9EBP2_9PEZI|nr:hypothetical protein CCHR01_18224 [Colletotrichum chrysophilum]